MERYRLAVGHDHGVMPGNIVGAIANEADITGKSIGRINIYDDYTLIDLPAGMPNDTFNALKKIWVAGQKLGITRLGDKEGFSEPAKRSSPKGKHKLSLPKGKTHKKRDEKPKKKPKSRRP
jgi:ATP-dependent RNA helicase DeaD